METSILTTVKKTLSLEADDTDFDPEIVTFINSVLSTLNQIGVGPVLGFHIEDASATWDQLFGTDARLNNIRAYVSLKVRLLFDPPATSFAITAMENMAKEMEYRIYTTMEVDTWQIEHPEIVILLP